MDEYGAHIEKLNLELILKQWVSFNFVSAIDMDLLQVAFKV